MSGVVTDLMRAERAEEQLARLAADLLTLCRAGDVVNGMVDTNAIRLLVKAVSNPYIVGRVHIGYCPVCLSEGPYDEPCYRCHLPLYLYDDDPDYEQDSQ
jgi:hypothetical protein